MLKRIISLLALAAIVLAATATNVRAQGGDIVDVATSNGNFKTLLAAAEAAGLVDALKGAGPLTVFAPTDEAFAKVPPMVIAYLLKPENKELLASILTYHVVSGKVMAADAMGMAGAMAATLNGGEIMVNVMGDSVMINGATVVAADVEASNGVIHVIDSVLLPTITLPEVDVLAAEGNVLTAGSSTVFPLSTAVAALFKEEGFAGDVQVASVGTGAGFERFCKAGETDIANASRAIKSSEEEDCAKINREPIGFFVGVDALSVVVGKGTDYVKGLTLAQLKDIFSGVATKWNQVDPSYPADDIKVFVPGTDSGTFEYFVEVVLEKKKELLLNVAGANFSEDDNVLVQGVAGTKGAIGFFGFAYYLPNADKLTALDIEGVAANEENAESGAYALARPLFIYTTAAILQEKPQVAAFVNFYLTNYTQVLGTEAGKVAYFAGPSDSLNNLMFLAATSK
jgi:phosphate transport system substrate-binding protein